MSNDTAASPDATPAPRFRGGLPAVPRGMMPTLFSLTIFWLLAGMLAFVLIPYSLLRNTDSRWVQAGTILLWSSLIAVSTAHGVMGYLLTYRRGMTPWFFVVGAAPGLVAAIVLELTGINPMWGAVLFPIALLGIALATSSKPLAAPTAPGTVLRALDRLAFHTGNLWWGIAQLLVILVVLVRASVYETEVGGSVGNQAAYVSYYNAWWFGVLLVVFFATIYCATMRKWPFRVSQTGWLSVHAGLLGMLIGCMAMHWGSYEGRLALYEGEASSEVRSVEERELEVFFPAQNFRKSFLLATDRDPTKEDISEAFKVNVGGRDYSFSIDKQYARAEHYNELQGSPAHDRGDGHAHHSGVELTITPASRGSTHILLEDARTDLEFGSLFAVYLRRIDNARLFRGFTHRYGPGDPNRGNLIVRSRTGKLFAEIPIVLRDRSGHDQLGLPIEGIQAEIKELDLTIEVVRYFDFFSHGQNTGIFDESPGRPQMPGLIIDLESPRGRHKLAALASGAFGLVERADTDLPPDLVFDYECTPEFARRPSSMTIALRPAPDKNAMVIVDGKGDVRIEDFEVSKTYRLSAEAPVAVTPVRYFEHATVKSGYRPAKSDSGFRTIRVHANDGHDFTHAWIVNDIPTRDSKIQLGGTWVELAYKSRRRQLEFSLACRDFREFRYPNSTKPKAYETNVVLSDPETSIDEAVLIDMNRPLDYRGYRFFNSSPIHDEENRRRGVVLQVTRNPGYWLIIVSCIVVTIGFIIVFTFKPALRRIESRRRQQARAAAPPLGGAAIIGGAGS